MSRLLFEAVQARLNEQFNNHHGRRAASARLQAARRILEDTELELKRVAAQSGLGTVASMRRVFLRELGVTPVQYREKFQRQI